MFIIRIVEVYLIIAEADIYLNGGVNVAKYLNEVRERAGADPLTGSMTVHDVSDERGRELCGEYCRFYGLKRIRIFKNPDYLKGTHPDPTRFLDPNYVLRPISITFTATIISGSEYQNPGYQIVRPIYSIIIGTIIYIVTIFIVSTDWVYFPHLSTLSPHRPNNIAFLTPLLTCILSFQHFLIPY